MSVDLESLATALENDLDDFESLTDQVFVQGHNILKTGEARITLHGAAVVETVVRVCCGWWKRHPIADEQSHTDALGIIERELRKFGKRREAMGS